MRVAASRTTLRRASLGTLLTVLLLALLATASFADGDSAGHADERRPEQTGRPGDAPGHDRPEDEPDAADDAEGDAATDGEDQDSTGDDTAQDDSTEGSNDDETTDDAAGSDEPVVTSRTTAVPDTDGGFTADETDTEVLGLVIENPAPDPTPVGAGTAVPDVGGFEIGAPDTEVLGLVIENQATTTAAPTLPRTGPEDAGRLLSIAAGLFTYGLVALHGTRRVACTR